LDLRTVFSEQDEMIAAALNHIGHSGIANRL
jgi:hypothetical protein